MRSGIDDLIGEHFRLAESGVLKGAVLKWVRGKPILIDSFTREPLSPKLSIKDMMNWLTAFEAGYRWAKVQNWDKL